MSISGIRNHYRQTNPKWSTKEGKLLIDKIKHTIKGQHMQSFNESKNSSPSTINLNFQGMTSHLSQAGSKKGPHRNCEYSDADTSR